MKYKFASLTTCLFWIAGLMAQLPVSQQPENKNVVLEEYTGIYCTFCPDGHRLANQFKAANPGDVVLLNIHAGSFAIPNGNDPDFRTTQGPLIASAAGIVGYPAGSVNRRYFQQYSQGGGTAMSRSNWAAAGNIILGEASYVNIAMDAVYDISTNRIHADVEMYLTGTGSLPAGSSLSLVVALLQNNVEGPQVGSGSNPSQVLPNGNYNHTHMFRDLLSSSRFGDNVDFSTGPLASMSYIYDVPSVIGDVPTVPEDMEVVAYLLEVPSYEIITGCDTEMQVGFLSQDEFAVQHDLRVYPNPANETINLDFRVEDKANLQLEIFDLSGKLVKSVTRNFNTSGKQSEIIDIAELAPGSYLLKTHVKGNSNVARLLIQR
jgi:hypothetical protein